MMNVIFSSSPFRILGAIASAYQSIRQLFHYAVYKGEELRAQSNVGFSPEDLDEEPEYGENDGYLHFASSALCILNAYELVTANMTPITPFITCAIAGKTACDALSTTYNAIFSTPSRR